MSERGWIDFLRADGVDDWAVLHGGATAVFRVASLDEAAALAAAIAQVPDLERSGVLMTVASDRLTVRLTRGVFRLEPYHVDLARAVSKVARNRGAVPDRGAVQEVQLAIAAKPGAVDVDFWRAVLGYSPLAEDNAIDPLGHGSTVWMRELDPDKQLRHAMHVDVSLAREHAEARVAAALAAGGRIVDESEAPQTGSSLTAPGTRSASPPGPTALSGLTRLEPEGATRHRHDPSKAEPHRRRVLPREGSSGRLATAARRLARNAGPADVAFAALHLVQPTTLA